MSRTRWYPENWKRVPPPAGPSLFDSPLPDPASPIPGKIGHTHPDTSVTAARLVAPKAATQRGQILALAYERGDLGFIAADAATRIGRSRNQTAARMLELREQGWLTYLPDGKGGHVKRRTEGENESLVHVLTAAAARVLDDPQEGQ